MSSGNRRGVRGRGRGSDGNMFLRGMRMRNEQAAAHSGDFSTSGKAQKAPPMGSMMMYYQSMMTGCVTQSGGLSPPYTPVTAQNHNAYSAPVQPNNNVQGFFAPELQVSSLNLRTGRVSVEELMGGPMMMPPGVATAAPPDGRIQQQQHNLKVAELFGQIPRQQTGRTRVILPSARGGASQQPRVRRPIYAPYMDKETVQRGLKRGEFVQGKLRVNQRNFEESYIEDPENDTDILIYGLQDRNRAFHTDVVVVQIKQKDLWRVNEEAFKTLLRKKREEENRSKVVELDTSLSSVYTTATEGLDGTSSGSSDSDSSAVVIVDRNSEDTSRSATPRKQQPAQQPPNRCYTRNQLMDVKKKVGESYGVMIRGLEQRLRYLDIQRRPFLACLDPQIPSRDAEGGVGGSSSQGSGRTSNGAQKKTIKTLLDFPGQDVPESCLTKTAEVVYITEKKHSRMAVGFLKPMADKSRTWALFSPNDSRLPRMLIPREQLPKGFFERPQDFAKYIYIARVEDWQPNAQFAKGKLCKSLGEAGEIEPETEGMLAQYEISADEFTPEALESLPKLEEGELWTIPDAEFGYRRDFRDECVLTIDPTTARDLDDALHIKKTGDGFFEVGVHIADVSFFLEEETSLNDEAQNRATSVYLVHKVIPMLPRLLCEDLCSLNSGVDRLSFSVIWKMDKNADIHDVWFGRSVIRSRCKLTYDIAQGFLTEPQRVWDVSELPPISDGVDPKELSISVNMLNKLAKKLRKKRYDSGALRLDQPKLAFALDAETGLPNGCSVYEIKDSNRLIEEFMLLANMSVARKIYENFPMISVLRRHPPPAKKILREVLDLCQRLGYPIDGSSSGDIQRSLTRHSGSSERAEAVMAVLSQLCMKPMKLALYFCTGVMKREDEFHHYALNVPFYTHFTSPIRRYPDVMVHRLLGAALGYCKKPDWKPKEVEVVCDHCNDKKSAAKTVSELSADLFFCIFVKECGPIEERAIVMNVMDHSLDVLLVRYGIVKRIYCDVDDGASERL